MIRHAGDPRLFREHVKVAGQGTLARFGLTETDRWRPEVVAVKIVIDVDAYEVQLVNQTSHGGLLLKKGARACSKG